MSIVLMASISRQVNILVVTVAGTLRIKCFKSKL